MMQGMKGMGVPASIIPTHKSKVLQGGKDDSDSPEDKNRHIFDDDDEDCEGASDEEDNSDLSSNEQGEAYEDEEPSDGYADEDDEDSDEPNLKDLTEPPTEAELEKMKKEKVSNKKLDLASAEEEKTGCGE